MRVEWRDETKTAYFLLEEDGTEILQRGGVKEEWKLEARRKKESLEAVILRHEAERLGKEATPTRQREVKIVRVEAEPHFHDDRYLLALPEHEHDEYLHEHKHEHPQIGEIVAELRGHELATIDGLRAAEKSLAVHTHPGAADREHTHPLEEHAHPHEHTLPWHDHEQYEAQVKTLQMQLTDLNGRLVAVAQEWRGLLDAQAETFKAALKELAGAKHAHDEYAVRVDFDKHIEDVSKKADLHVLSEQEVAGKRRLVVEEAR